MVDVETRTFREVDLQNGTVISAFPSSGLVSAITASYLISMLDSDQVCALESEEFLPISMVYAKKPKFPVRVYSIHQSKVAVFVCEMPLPKGTHRAVARSPLQWSRANKCRQIVSLEGLPSRSETDEPLDTEPNVWGVRSTDKARGELNKHGVELLESGVISGVTGVLLNEGRWENYDVIALLAEARSDLPDAHAAVAMTESVQLASGIESRTWTVAGNVKAIGGLPEEVEGTSEASRAKDSTRTDVPLTLESLK